MRLFLCAIRGWKRIQVRNFPASMIVNCTLGSNGGVCITIDEENYKNYNRADWENTNYHTYIEYHWKELRDQDLVDVQSRRFRRWAARTDIVAELAQRRLLADWWKEKSKTDYEAVIKYLKELRQTERKWNPVVGGASVAATPAT